MLQKLLKNAPVCYGVAIRTAFAFSRQAFSSHSVSPKDGGMMTELPVSLDIERDLIDPIVQLLRWLKLFAIVYPSFANSRSLSPFVGVLVDL